MWRLWHIPFGGEKTPPTSAPVTEERCRYRRNSVSAVAPLAIARTLVRQRLAGILRGNSLGKFCESDLPLLEI